MVAGWSSLRADVLGAVGQYAPLLERAAVGELVAQGGEEQSPFVLSSSAIVSRTISNSATFSSSTTPSELNSPRSLASAAATRRSVSPRSAARRAAARRVCPVGRLAGQALGGPQPDGQVETQHRVGVGDLGIEIEGLGVVAEGVGRRQRFEGGVAGLAE